MKKNGHYCKVCGRHRANEKFTGKGHATHICAKLPPEEKAKQETLNRLFNLPWYLSKEQKYICQISAKLASKYAINLSQPGNGMEGNHTKYSANAT